MNAVSPGAAAAPAVHSLYSVPGISCANCIAKLERGLSAVPGIMSVRVNFGQRRVAIDHAPELTVPAIQQAIYKLGFDTQPVRELDASENRSATRSLVRATGVAGFASMNVMLLSVSVWSGATGATRDLFHLISAVIAIPAVAYSGRVFFASAWAALRRGRTNMDVPISIGVLLVCALSLFEALTGGPHAYFDGAVMLLFFLLVGRTLDSVMRDRARDGVAALLKHSPPGALVLGPKGRTRWCDVEALDPGMRMIVAAGERLAADGVVEQGVSSLDLSLITGESEPQPRSAGDRVEAGTLNLLAPLTVRITAAGADTTLADIARLMEQAGQGKSRYVRIADRAARYYAPAVHSLALLSFLGWVAAGAGWHQALLISAAVLIITCPCALGLAVPAAQIVAAGALMRKGVLIKDGSALERLAEADHACFDKTGTLTLGSPQPLNLEGLSAEDKGLLLALAQVSRHPLSLGIRRALESEALSSVPLEKVEEEPGFGVRASWRETPVSLGRPAGSAEIGLVTALTIGAAPPVLIRFADEIRPGARECIDRLRSMGIDSSILSGDGSESVGRVADDLGIEAKAGLRPEAKLAEIATLAERGRKVLMVGDGLNDGPALAAGHVSMAPASASDVGQNAADAVFMGDSLAPVATSIAAARRTMRIVRQNLVLAIGYNAFAIPLALLGLVTPLLAALAMSGSSIIVVGNALRLRSAAR